MHASVLVPESLLKCLTSIQIFQSPLVLKNTGKKYAFKNPCLTLTQITTFVCVFKVLIRQKGNTPSTCVILLYFDSTFLCNSVKCTADKAVLIYWCSLFDKVTQNQRNMYLK